VTSATQENTGPTRQQQLAAWLAYLSLAVAVVYLVAVVFRRWEVLLAGLVTLAVMVVALWFAVSRRGTTRLVALGAAVAALALLAWVMVASSSVRVLVVGVLLAAVSTGAARLALRPPSVAPERVPSAPRGDHSVLIMNPWSGGGKVEKFELERLCRERGIEPIVLYKGSDLLALAEDAVERGADVIGMAGGDGSQSTVAAVAASTTMVAAFAAPALADTYYYAAGTRQSDKPSQTSADEWKAFLGSDHDPEAYTVQYPRDLAPLIGEKTLDDSVAEGVERPDQYAALRELGCSKAQGYLWGRPAVELPPAPVQVSV